MGYSDDMKDYDVEVKERQNKVRVPIRKRITRKNGRWYLIEEILPRINCSWAYSKSLLFCIAND